MYVGVAVPVSYYGLYVSCSGVHFSLGTVHVCASPPLRRTPLAGAETTYSSMWRPGSPRDPDGGGPSRGMDLSRSPLGVSRGHVRWGDRTRGGNPRLLPRGRVTRGHVRWCMTLMYFL